MQLELNYENDCSESGVISVIIAIMLVSVKRSNVNKVTDWKILHEIEARCKFKSRPRVTRFRMPPKRRYKQWQRDRNVPIPRRTLARLKKEASTYCIIHKEDSLADYCTLASEITGESASDIRSEGVLDEITTDQTTQTQEENISCEIESSEDEVQSPEHSQCENISLAKPFHVKEDGDYRDIDSDEASYRCESTDGEDSELDEMDYNDNAPKQLYPGASITVEDSILSIMKYALRHKTSYSALSDLLNLIALHLPTESNTEHLRSLYFLKKAFSAQSEHYGHEQSDIVTVHEYCPNYTALWRSDNDRTCRFCGKTRKKKSKNYFLALDIGAQLKSLFKGKIQNLFGLIRLTCK